MSSNKKHGRPLKQKLLPAIQHSTELDYGKWWGNGRCVEDDGCAQTWQTPHWGNDRIADYTLRLAPYTHPRTDVVHALYHYVTWGDRPWRMSCRVAGPDVQEPSRNLTLDDVTCQPCLRCLGVKTRAELSLQRTQALLELWGRHRLLRHHGEVWVVPDNSLAGRYSTVRAKGFLLARRYEDGWWELDGTNRHKRLNGTLLRYLRVVE